MNRIYTILLLVFLVPFSVEAQKIVPNPDDLYSDATEFIISGDYNEALYIFLSLHDKGYKTANICYKIGECYLNIAGAKTKALPWLEKAIQNHSDRYKGTSLQEEYAPSKALLYMGIACRLNYDFDRAIRYFNDYLNTLDDTDADNRKLVEYHIERCLNARELIASPALFNTDTLPDVINTVYSNFNPLVSTGENKLFYMNQLKFYDAVMLAGKINGTWNEPDNLTPKIQSDGDHYLTGLSADGTTLLLTAYDPYKSGEIYITRQTGEEWTALQKVEGNVNTVFNETHASLSPDGKTLYFTSDRKGGYGGLDIYISTADADGKWQEPRNLGPLINTAYNEESPFVSSDGSKLYFSSQGHYNMGGYDVFVSSKDTHGKWLSPVNIGYPLNTTDDDMFYFPLDSGYVAYQSRFEGSSTQQDIVRLLVKAFGKPIRFLVGGKMDVIADSGFQAENISVSFLSKPRMDTLASVRLNPDGSFSQKVASGSYLVNFSDHSNILLSKNLSIPDNFPGNRLVLSDKISVPRLEKKCDTLYISDIRFGFDQSKPDKNSLSQLDSLIYVMSRYPQCNLEIIGYTDAIGGDAYNLKLSKNRAGNIKDYMLTRIASQRIMVNGYGESNAVAPNNHADGSDFPEARQFNRRAELILLNLPDSVCITKLIDIPSELRLR
ncbi:MAG TPA: OmpA family protein [Bacteroidales bacterium]|nr:OmpA family protein [Bacteroidales bacterium]